LAPPRADNLASSSGCQDGKLECARRDAPLLAQAHQEARQLRVWQRRMVFDPPHLGARRQQLIEAPAPSGWVLARAISAHLRPIQDGLDTPADAARSLGLRRPDRLQDPEHERSIDDLHRETANDGLGIGGERRLPLRRMLGVAPAGSMAGNVPCGAFFESYTLLVLAAR